MRLSQDADNLPKRSESPGGGIWSFHVVVADVDQREGRFLLGELRIAPTQKKSGLECIPDRVRERRQIV